MRADPDPNAVADAFALGRPVLYKTFRTPWFDYFMASPDEMAEVADGTGWFLERVINYPNWTSPVYFGVLKKET